MSATTTKIAEYLAEDVWPRFRNQPFASIEDLTSALLTEVRLHFGEVPEVQFYRAAAIAVETSLADVEFELTDLRRFS